jgi:hypothetical protein
VRISKHVQRLLSSKLPDTLCECLMPCLFGLFASSVLCSRQSEGEHFLEVNIFKTCIGKLYPNDCVSPWMFRTPFEVAGTPHA